MRNRAKCKLCEDIIESIEWDDWIMCSCESIAIGGGDKAFHTTATDYNNFLRIDDDGNEIPVTYVENKPQTEEISDNSEQCPENKLTRAQKVDMLKAISDSIENLPQHAMQTPITHYDYNSLLLLLISIFRDD